ncbi:MAG: hypothetical protein KJ621_14335 [Proteobacteria bacterium]|nr:hypothetical protein [Pseudomonadota bacterium]MBU1741960.1 hypothetical protein [Pseudomonadota bacterium]
MYYDQLDAPRRKRFLDEINSEFILDNCPWRLHENGQIIKQEADLMSVYVFDSAEELMEAEGFEGALDEFKKAREKLAAGDSREAITNACHSFESALKTILGIQSGNASELIKKLIESGYCDDLPGEIRSAFGNQVLMTLPSVGNRLGRHGQGETVVQVTEHYATLAVHLAGAFIILVANKYRERNKE